MDNFLILLLCVICWSIYTLFFKKKAGLGSASWPRPGMPSDFNPTHAHDNVALDAKTKRLWVREESGREQLFEACDITGWSATNSTSSNAYGKSWPANVYLEIKTTSVDKPLWRARFKRYGEKMPEQRNYNDCQEWFERLNAVYNHS